MDDETTPIVCSFCKFVYQNRSKIRGNVHEEVVFGHLAGFYNCCTVRVVIQETNRNGVEIVKNARKSPKTASAGKSFRK